MATKINPDKEMWEKAGFPNYPKYENVPLPIAQIMESLGVKSNRTIYKYLQQKGIKANRK